MINEITKESKEKMNKAIESLKRELSTLRAGRANPSMLDKIVIDYYGSPTPLSQMATISVPEARMLTVQPWDASIIPLIEKGIMASDIGINPSNDGKIIRLAIPQLTEERRKELSKQVSKEGENAKVSIRNIRRNAIQHMKDEEKNKLITEDDVKDGEKIIQKDTDSFIKNIDEIVKAKEKEIMTV